MQLAVAKGVQVVKFAKCPEKPWLGDDYFDSRNSEAHVDLIEILGSDGSSNPPLNETASVFGTLLKNWGERRGGGPPMWLEGSLADIVAYNEWDALSTYFILLRMADFGRFFDQNQYSEEDGFVRKLLSTEVTLTGKELLLEFLERW